MQEYPLDQNTEERQTIKKTAFNIPAIIDMLRSRLEFEASNYCGSIITLSLPRTKGFLY